MDILTWMRSQWDRLLAGCAMVAGAVALFLGWLGVSGTVYAVEQLPYIVSGAVGGLFLLGISSALWLSADLRDEWRKLDRIERAIRAADIDTPATTNPHPEPRQTERIPAVAIGASR